MTRQTVSRSLVIASCIAFLLVCASVPLLQGLALVGDQPPEDTPEAQVEDLAAPETTPANPEPNRQNDQTDTGDSDSIDDDADAGESGEPTARPPVSRPAASRTITVEATDEPEVSESSVSQEETDDTDRWYRGGRYRYFWRA